MELTPELKTALDGFAVMAQKKIDDRWEAMKFTHAMSPQLEIDTSGSRFVRVFKRDRSKEGVVNPKSGSIYAFIDAVGGMVLGAPTKVGDILKPASYKAPAKHARGSIFAEDFGASCCSDYGPQYLK